MSLVEYKRKRKFAKTPEPGGGAAKKKSTEKKLLFVVQKHAASHLHYDFRLELKGALKSWAVPKGPSMNPEDKRLAMLVEDHPFDYKDFEGVIPEGNYGAGTVIVWDQGTYEPAEKFETVEEQERHLVKSFYSGKLSIILKGKKLKGEFALVKAAQRGDNSWLLMKKNDSYASPDDVTKKSKSVVSGKDLLQVAKDKKSKQWISNRASNGELKKEKNKKLVKKAPVLLDEDENRPEDMRTAAAGVLKTAGKKKRSPFPKNLKPMLATLTDEPFDTPGWTYEVKWDGYRALAYVNGKKSELRSRNNNSFDEQFYPVLRAVQDWNIKAVVDGEIVVVNEKGLSSFSALQQWRSEADGELLYYVFDILWLEGYDLTQLLLTERREIVKKLVPEDSIARFSENFDASGHEFFKLAEKLGIEGVIAKKADSVYIPDSRTKLWLKIKTEQRHEAVIAGYTKNEDSGKLFSALIVGVYENDELKFIGQVGTGFTEKMQREILQQLKPLETKRSPFKEQPVINKPTRFRPNPPKAEVHWVKPKLICEVKYTELTPEGIMRHPSFQGMRTDKEVKEVRQEKPVEHPAETKTAARKKAKAEKFLSEKKLIAAPAGKTRKDFLNPHDESQQRTINGHSLKFTNLSKIYWPKEKITKRDMLNYYYRVAPYILPYMKDRPQSLNRFPHGINGESFYQKNVKGKVESWIATHDYKNTTQEGEKTFLVCKDEATLMYMANLGCIEMHPWHSRVQNPDMPDWCVVDLDPDTNPFEQVIEVALVVKKVLDAIGLPSYPKTSGSTGMHIYIPLGAKYSYEQSKQLAHLIVSLVHPEVSSFTSLERSPANRKGKIYLDYLQNRAIQTIAAPYSIRPKPGATVSAPLNWEEVKKGLKISDFNIFNMPSRIEETGDLFKPVLGKGIDIGKALEKMKEL
jgi:bifunctional non-homologous end joining protein LigD